MIFQKPQWVFRIWPERVDYGFVSNVITIYPLRGRAAAPRVYVTVPIELFQLLDATLSDSQKAEAHRHKLSFFLEQTGADGGLWVLGIETPDQSVSLDLWTYPAKSLPPWYDVAMRTLR